MNVPTATERFDQLHGGGHGLRMKRSELLLSQTAVWSARSARSSIDLLPFHTCRSQFEILLGGLHRQLLLLNLFGKDAFGRQIIFHLLEGG